MIGMLVIVGRESWEVFDLIETAGYSCYCIIDEQVTRVTACATRHAKKHHHRIKQWLAAS